MDDNRDVNKFLDNIARGPSAVFATFFAASCVLHAWQSRKYKCWSYTWPLPCACIVMTAGFICREVAADYHDADGLGSAVQGLFYSAAVIFTLPLYKFLLCSSVTTELLPRLNLTISYIMIWTFTSAVISCTAQGASTYFNPDAKKGTVTSSLALLKASLFLQLAPNGAFICLLLLLLFRQDANAARRRALLMSSFVLMALICVRNLFRTIQLFSSPRSRPWTDEAYFWVFEGCVMLSYTVLFHVLHLGKFVPTGLYDCSQGRRRCS
ncbi:uncharacterized protein PV07_04983 [Cladophialophora immunda]|uniref:Uncharacterized protein n=1 Tax=Cladophialophora immunda TaxID=569365 RepID=A0A0D2AV51_9EURO|nr:uncharacterized protein PV07_04983 [Cladophialophora immunda]KIW29147.1 hypothetical protein PV07_04983 [Cladophialophora immunda]OQU96951.1 hypothetical protein CLAIMM_02957 [Cladophialophora immunda]